MNVLFTICNASLLIFMIYRLYQTSHDLALRPFLIPAIGAKIVGGIGLGLVFLHYYEGTGDTLRFFDEAKRYADLGRSDFFSYLNELAFDSSNSFQSVYHRQPRALLFAKITSLFALLTNDSYWITSAYFSLFCFYGLWTLANQLVRIYNNKAAIVLSLLFFPSVVFWSAGVTKESVAIGVLALLISSFVGYVHKDRKATILHVVSDVICLIILWEIKYYYAGAFILVGSAATGVLLISTYKMGIRNSPFAQVALLMFGCIVMSLIISITQPNFNLDRMAKVIAFNHNAFVNKSSAAEIIHYNNLEGKWKSLLFNMPEALTSGLFRPLPGDGHGWLSLASKAENIFILLLTLTSLSSLKMRMSARDRILFFTALFYCFGLATFLALFAPNFGTLVRYRVGFLPVFLLLITLHNPLIKKLNRWHFGQ